MLEIKWTCGAPSLLFLYSATGGINGVFLFLFEMIAGDEIDHVAFSLQSH